MFCGQHTGRVPSPAKRCDYPRIVTDLSRLLKKTKIGTATVTATVTLMNLNQTSAIGACSRDAHPCGGRGAATETCPPGTRTLRITAAYHR